MSVFTPAESGKANHWAVLMKNKSGTLKKRKKIKNKPEKEKKKEKRQSELKIIKTSWKKKRKKKKRSRPLFGNRHLELSTCRPKSFTLTESDKEFH